MCAENAFFTPVNKFIAYYPQRTRYPYNLHIL